MSARPISREILIGLANSYPSSERAEQLADVDRILDHIRLLQARVPAGGAILDLCGGMGLFSVGCAAVGMNVTLVDDFNDSNNQPIAQEALQLHRKMGVAVIVADVMADPPKFERESLDAVTCFDALEHFHHSPKGLLQRLVEALKPGGLLLLQTPNCVNLRKRLTVPFGRGKWSPLEEWYEKKIFRAHVREPDVSDLLYIGRSLKLDSIEILGRNWLGYGSRNPVIRNATRCIDRFLRLRPSLCSNIYLLGRKKTS